ncbi:4'-phosphopantetheinyl transferase family protein [Winogradskyella bathintestinalis]|uniref:4'-phosphopantetheinyl transferase superfamily protein n=1 Tax=Winogradskyella bathintestinalis TaxID=3035208 RepID=A0ABT7ZT11_9FLAO|nr:4'-phosphopantetheinyl transferase superfamily protein [Winogradskyella bathintestinalis]MDN3492156.1 4'-phosphopantetheinyl transferase superfamily protein [Winogradskyella bathintestinalis]
MSQVYNVFCHSTKVIIVPFDKFENNSEYLNIFKIKLSLYQNLVIDFLQFLTPVEMQRAERYYSPKDKSRFIICRTLLKFILAQKTGLEIENIIFEKDNNKKPYLPFDRSINFNVSHSENYALIALSHASVGIDVEYMNRDFNFLEIIPSTFNDLEIRSVLKAANKKEAFYTCWTRKEAFVKATGKGIDDNIAQIPALDGQHTKASHLLGEFKNMTVFSFDLDEKYKAAVAFSETMISEEIVVSNLPTTLQELIEFKSINRT